MEENILLSNLYDYYGVLLTEKQQQYFEDYYFDNLTLAEMSENYKVSRNAIHKSLKEVEDKLLDFEDKLQLYHKNQKIIPLLEKIEEPIKSRLEELL